MRIAISPDENPGDPGSVAADGTTERSVNVRVANALLAALRRCGVDAWFDSTITYVQRVTQANADGTAVLVACAHNESTPGSTGSQFVFCASGGLAFGQQAAAADAVYAELAGSIAGWPRLRSYYLGNIYECCVFQRDTVYIEYCCMSDADRPFWADPALDVPKAEATARALARVYGFTYVPEVDVFTPDEHDLIVNAARQLATPLITGSVGAITLSTLAAHTAALQHILDLLAQTGPSQDAAKLDELKAQLESVSQRMDAEFRGLRLTETAS